MARRWFRRQRRTDTDARAPNYFDPRQVEGERARQLARTVDHEGVVRMTPAQLCRHFSVVGLDVAVQRRIQDALHAEGLVCLPSLYSETVVKDTIAIRREATPPQSE